MREALRENTPPRDHGTPRQSHRIADGNILIERFIYLILESAGVVLTVHCVNGNHFGVLF